MRAEEEPRREPVVHAAPFAPVPAFKAVSQHDAADDDSHRPNRRRRQEAADAASQSQELQLVETQLAAPVIAAADDEPQRRSKPRRRRSGPAEAEPLQLVETQPNAEGQRPDSAPTP
jgi:hypothetical protein